MDNFGLQISYINKNDVVQVNRRFIELTHKLALEQKNATSAQTRFPFSDEVAEIFADIPPEKFSINPEIKLPICELYQGTNLQYWQALTDKQDFKETECAINENNKEEATHINRLFLHIMQATAFKDIKLAEVYTYASKEVITLFLQLDTSYVEKLIASDSPLAVLKNRDVPEFWRKIINAYYSDTTTNQKYAAYHAMILNFHPPLKDRGHTFPRLRA